MKQSKLTTGKTNIIGITGGVGAGKSTILSYIQDNFNAMVIYSDQVANDIKKKGYPAYDELVALLGPEVLGEEGEIDKGKMAEAIFKDKTLLDKVNNVLHPAVNTFIINIIDSERAKGELDFVIVEAALLIENGYKDIVDELWYVYADEDIRRQRLKASRGYSDEKIDGILSKQLSDAEFREHCDFVIDNSRSEEEAYKQIDNKLGEWKKKWQV
ncbi:dephospho-CoA kinase [Butyrivibrio sp. CB08]|uniref:dephospho-CoA kinase n=1 Tax=Butyrivibrio sp. CB08 TaxID=2364879 RepID=UPI000EA89A85|nr:dephospho-CoA kinase [Butyrivibrio sp. CB08]RKM57559.1 dephospho-CoA kinase [Butyrivibrio sp. CB08]